MKNRKVKIASGLLILIVIFFTACSNPVMRKWWANHLHTWEWTASTVWGMETGVCSECAETGGLRLAPDMMGEITAGSVALSNDFISYDFTVTLSAFKMGKYQITQAQYEAVTGHNPSHFDGGVGLEPEAGEEQKKRPVERVTWFDAVEFCNKLSVLAGLTPVYSITGKTLDVNGYRITDAVVTADFTKNGYRLPTEAQWEYACRAGSTGDYSIGIDGIEVTILNLEDYAWYSDFYSRTHEVGKKIANAFGLFDMHGNVSEWCWDRYDFYPNEAKTDYTGPDGGNDRVHRGGSYDLLAWQVASSHRHYAQPRDPYEQIGFRVVCP